VRVVDEFERGFGWQTDQPEYLERTSHAVLSKGSVWLFDVLDVDGIDERVGALGEPGGVVQLLDRHARDCAAVASRLGVPHFEPLTKAPVPTVPVASLPGWRERAAFLDDSVLVAADALGTASYFRAPGERLAVHPMLRLFPPRALRGLAPEHVLCGHGVGVHGSEAAEALDTALRTARRRIPRWLPASIRAWRGR
jgi:hypothetical protein